MNILSAENLGYSVHSTPRDVKKILSGINLEVSEGSTLGISGESGSGKTTLAKILAGHLKPTSGKLSINLTPLNKSNPVQLLFQNTGSILHPLRRVNEMVAEAAYVHCRDNKKAMADTENLFNHLDFSRELWNKRGYELSGGEQQRAALARILAVKPQLLILDEPFAAQDVQSQLRILNLLKKIKDEFSLTIICISHNIRILENFSDPVIIMKNGTIASQQEVRSEN